MPTRFPVSGALFSLVITASVAGAQAPPGHKGIPQKSPEARQEFRERADAVMKEIGVSEVGFVDGRTNAGLVLQNWKTTGLTLDSLLPIARRGLLSYVAHRKAPVADTLFAQFVDYTPRCATIVWVRKPVTRPPDRFILTDSGRVCRRPGS